MPEEQNELARRHMHPKLRQFEDCTIAVSSAKAEVHGSLKVTNAKYAGLTPPLATAAAPGDIVPKEALKRRNLRHEKDRYGAVTVNVFVRSILELPHVEGQQSLGGYATRQLSLEEVSVLASDLNTIFVEPADSLKPPRPWRGNTSSSPPSRANSRAPAPSPGGGGKGVLIGIIDVEGFDWTHPDFMTRGRSRITSIWDQGTDGKPPERYTYGNVISAADMRLAVREAKTALVSPHDLLPQSQMASGSHGTHVASIAAGASGVCPAAEIAAVLISLPDGEIERRTSFYDSTRLLDAIHYLLKLAGADRPISINISLGTNGHAHDGSSILDRWIDALLAEPGRSICVAAGNAGQERPEAPDDLGYMLGRIHASGTIGAQGLGQILEWEVIGDGRKDASENEMEIWFEPQDRFAISLKPPDGDWIGPIAPGQYLENFQLPDRSIISIYNELHHPANGANYAALYLTPFMSEELIVGIPSGSWQVKLDGLTVRDGRFHAWIERDDPASLGDDLFYWPSYFSQRSHVDTSTVSSLACGQRIVSVANLDEGLRSAHITSSQGPTRDDREKPDIIARGTDIVAANGFGEPSDPWISMTGTSMASPFVAGVIGLMLEAEPHLTAAQILGILKATAQPLPGASYRWLNDSGFGVINPAACVDVARTVLSRKDVKANFKRTS